MDIGEQIVNIEVVENEVFIFEDFRIKFSLVAMKTTASKQSQ